MRLTYRKVKHVILTVVLLLAVVFVQQSSNSLFFGKITNRLESAQIKSATIPSDWSEGSLRSLLLKEYEDVERLAIPKRIWQSWKSKENLEKS